MLLPPLAGGDVTGIDRESNSAVTAPMVGARGARSGVTVCDPLACPLPAALCARIVTPYVRPLTSPPTVIAEADTACADGGDQVVPPSSE